MEFHKEEQKEVQNEGNDILNKIKTNLSSGLGVFQIKFRYCV